MWRFIGGALGLAAVIVLFQWNEARTYRAGFEAGAHEQAMAIVRWRDAVLEQEKKRRADQLERWEELQEVVDELRSRPAEIRERIRTITVAADDRCVDLPREWRVQWNADPPAAGLHPGPSVARAGLGDAAPADLAAAFR